MTSYVAFGTRNGTLLLETDLPSTLVREGQEQTGKASGILDEVRDTVAKGTGLFEDAVKTSIEATVNSFYSALASLSHPPSEVSIEFGLKVSGEVGNVIISKASAEANYTIKLNWKMVP